MTKSFLNVISFLGIEISDSNLKLFNIFKDAADELNAYNDPRGIYMQCFCELK
jgi:hypothetical protein